MAGKKNWDVNGMRSASPKRMGISSLLGNDGTCMIVSQNTARTRWKTYIVSEGTNVWARSRAMVSNGDSDLSRRPTAALNAVRNVRAGPERLIRKAIDDFAVVKLVAACSCVEQLVTKCCPESCVDVMNEREKRGRYTVLTRGPGTGGHVGLSQRCPLP